MYLTFFIKENIFRCLIPSLDQPLLFDILYGSCVFTKLDHRYYLNHKHEIQQINFLKELVCS